MSESPDARSLLSASSQLNLMEVDTVRDSSPSSPPSPSSHVCRAEGGREVVTVLLLLLRSDLPTVCASCGSWLLFHCVFISVLFACEQVAP